MEAYTLYSSSETAGVCSQPFLSNYKTFLSSAPFQLFPRLQYSRITLTRFTTFYFFLALASCIILSALQGVAFVDNSQAVTALAPLVKNVPSAQVLVLEKGVLQTCTSIPNQRGTKCTVKLVFGANKTKRDLFDDSLKVTLFSIHV